jgi:hypothetical protein
MKVLPGYTRAERSAIHPSDHHMIRDVDGELVRAYYNDDGTIGVEVTDYEYGRYIKRKVVTIIDSDGVCYSIPLQYLEEQPLV